MAAPKKNEFWKARATHGRDKIFENEEILLEACCEYFQWVEDNPLYEDKPFTYLGKVIPSPVAKMRAMTLDGLHIFLDIARNTWKLYKSRDDFMPVIEQVEKIIRTQKLEGAAAGLLNGNIIAREIGLAEKINAEVTGKDGTPIQTVSTTMTPKEAAQAFKEQIKDS